MKWKSRIQNFFDMVFVVQKKVTGLIFFALVALVTIQICGRLFLKVSTPWSEEGSRICFIWIVFLGAVGSAIRGEHIMVDLLYLRYPPKLRRFANAANSFLFLFFCLFMFVFGILLCAHPIIRRSVTVAMRISKLWIYAVLPISMGLMSLYFIFKLICDVIELVRGASSGK